MKSADRLPVGPAVLPSRLLAITDSPEEALRREHKRVLAALGESEIRYRNLFDASPVPMYVLDVETFDLLAVNQAAASLWGYPLEEMQRMKATDLRPPDEVDAFMRRITELDPESIDRTESRHHTRDGRDINVEVHSQGIHYAGRPARLTVAQDVTQRRELERALQTSSQDLAHAADHDALTGLPNRRAFMRRAAEALAAAPDSRHAVIIVNIDRFRSVNDTFGAAFGDALLREVAARIVATSREGEITARLDNVRFGVLWRDGSDGKFAPRLESLRQQLSGKLDLGSDGIMLSVTAGVAHYPDHGAELDTLVRNAGLAQQSARALGPGGVRLFDAEMASGLERRHQLESALEHALEQGAFCLHYQPKVDLARQHAVDMETLLRWPQADGSFISPVEFIPLLEETGGIVQVGEWVLQTAARQVRIWLDAGLPVGRMAVNVSPRQFVQANLAERLESIVRAARVPPSMFELEITESCLMHNAAQAASTLAELKKCGFFLAVDDFGTGYSSLGYLKRFPLDILKIDRTFVRDIVTDPDSAAIVHMIMALARSLKLRVVAEGVETAEQAALLARIGCEEAQGFFFSRPLDTASSTAWLARGGRCPVPSVDSMPGRTLLLVDDDPTILSALKLLLERDGYRIFTAENAEKGLRLLARNAVDVIICDQRLPSISGVEFLARVKNLYPDTVRMALSGYAELESVTEAVNRGAIYKFLTKPWDNEKLRKIVREAFEQKTPLQENRRQAHERAKVQARLLEASYAPA